MASATPLLTVRYRSSRADVWRWYWIAWTRPMGLWRYHVAISLLVAAFDALARRPAAVSWTHATWIFTGALIFCLVFFPLWPQVRFKPAERTLTIGPSGIDTSIGRRSAVISWKKVRLLELRRDTIVITGENKNAFIVPARAFGSTQERVAFYEAARGFRSAGDQP
jgi:hypothetical protein